MAIRVGRLERLLLDSDFLISSIVVSLFFTKKGLNFMFLMYRKVVTSNTFHLEAHAGFFRMLMKGIFDPYVL